MSSTHNSNSINELCIHFTLNIFINVRIKETPKCLPFPYLASGSAARKLLIASNASVEA